MAKLCRRPAFLYEIRSGLSEQRHLRRINRGKEQKRLLPMIRLLLTRRRDTCCIWTAIPSLRSHLTRSFGTGGQPLMVEQVGHFRLRRHVCLRFFDFGLPGPMMRAGRLTWFDRDGPDLPQRKLHRRLPDESRLAASLVNQSSAV